MYFFYELFFQFSLVLQYGFSVFRWQSLTEFSHFSGPDQIHPEREKKILPVLVAYHCSTLYFFRRSMISSRETWGLNPDSFGSSGSVCSLPPLDWQQQRGSWPACRAELGKLIDSGPDWVDRIVSTGWTPRILRVFLVQLSVLVQLLNCGDGFLFRK